MTAKTLHRKRWLWLVLATALLATELPAAETPQSQPAATQPAAVRPADWAQPLDKPGLTNLHKVNDHLYRGAQPTDEGFKQLKAMGIKTVVDLRVFHSDKEACRKYGLQLVTVSFKPWHGEDEDQVKFLKVVADKNNWPVFVHCQHGSDRTGTACAMYRIVEEGWSKDRAIEEMTQGGYGFHKVWENLIDYVRHADTDKIKKAASAPDPPATQPNKP